MSHVYNSLSTCINTLRESVDILGDSVKLLDETTRDVPRLKKVLDTQKVFGLVPEIDLINAKKCFRDEIKPQIDSTMAKIEKEMNKLNRKKTNLRSKYDLQAVRLTSSKKRDSFMGLPIKKINKDKLDELKLARLRLLRNKKERLKYSLSRLDLQEQRARLSLIPSLPHQ